MADLAGEGVSDWESRVTLETFVGAKSPYWLSSVWLSSVALACMVLLALAGLVTIAFRSSGGVLYGLLVVVEVCIALGLFISAYRAKEKTRAVARGAATSAEGAEQPSERDK